MSNKKVNLSTDSKQAFAIKNPTTGKIVAFINFSQYVDEAKANSITADQLADIIAQCDIEKFIKSDSADAFDGLL